LILSPMMTPTQPAIGAALLLVAGVYELTPLKYACLRNCQSPMSFLMHRRRVAHGGRSRRQLSRLLLGADAAALRGRGDEPRGNRGVDRICRLREARAVRRPRRARQWRAAGGRCPLDAASVALVITAPRRRTRCIRLA